MNDDDDDDDEEEEDDKEDEDDEDACCFWWSFLFIIISQFVLGTRILIVLCLKIVFISFKNRKTGFCGFNRVFTILKTEKH